jgi:hypothetical protein
MVFKNKELTAVDWLELIYNSGNLNPKSFREAKIIMKKQIVEAYIKASNDDLENKKKAEQYYDSKYENA